MMSKKQPTNMTGGGEPALMPSRRPISFDQKSKENGKMKQSASMDEGIAMSNELSEYAQSNSSTSSLNLKGKDLKQPGAYIISQRIKNECSWIKDIDLSDNDLQDEGIMHLAFALKSCSGLTSLTLSKNSLTEYGLRILLENINPASLIYLDISENNLGSKGAEHIANFLKKSKLKQLMMNSANLGEAGSKSVGVALSTNSSLKGFQLMSNNIKLSGATWIGRGLMTNSSVEEVNLACNNLGLEGAVAIGDCLKINKSLKKLNIHTNNFNYDSIKHLAPALRQNNTLKYLNMSFNNIGNGVYELLSALNTDTSALESLSIKNIPMPRHLILVVELIQQRRKFECEYSSISHHGDVITGKHKYEEESMVKLSRLLTEKRMRLIDLFKVLDKSEGSCQISKEEFSRRLKLFEPRLTNKDINNIAKSLSDKDPIDYKKLMEQSVAKPDSKSNMTKMKTQLNESDSMFLKNTKLRAQHDVQNSINTPNPATRSFNDKTRLEPVNKSQQKSNP